MGYPVLHSDIPRPGSGSEHLEIPIFPIFQLFPSWYQDGTEGGLRTGRKEYFGNISPGKIHQNPIGFGTSR